MATFLITTPPVASLVIPMLFMAAVLVKRGHLLVHSDRCEHTKVQAAGAELVPTSKNCNLLYRLENSQLNPPWLPKFIRRLFPLAVVRQQLDLPPRSKNAPAEFCSVVASLMLNLILIYEVIASGKLRKNQTFIGPAVFEMPRPKDKEHLDKEHLDKSLEPGSLLVSITTANNLDDGLFSLVLRSIAQMKIPILATSASATDIPLELASKVRIEDFVPHEEVLPYIAAFVTNGEFGSVERALKHSVPMLIISSLAESAATRSHAEKLGSAYHLPQSKVTPEAIQAKLKALLEDRKLHARVKSVSEKLRSMDAPELTARAIEAIL